MVKKIIFKSKVIYWFSVVFFALSCLFCLTALSTQIGNDFHIFSFLYLSVLAVLSVIICVKLFEKERSVFLYINVFLTLLLILLLFNSIKIYSTHYTYEPENIFFAVLLMVYMVTINKNKILNSEIAMENEIDEIGK